jgi:aspartate racemase
VAHTDNNNECYLTAFIEFENQIVSSPELRSFLLNRLPQHAVPRFFTPVKSLPRTSNGKIDRVQLVSIFPHISMLQDSRLTANASCDNAHKVMETSDAVNSDDEIERRLKVIWKKVLQVPYIERYDDFFEMGGHSLLAAVLVSQIEKELSQTLPLSSLFLSSTIAAQAELLRQNSLSPNRFTLHSGVVALQPLGLRPPLFCIADMGDNLLCYRNLVQSLGKDQPIYGLQPADVHVDVEDVLNGARLSTRSRTIEDMAAFYVREIIAFQPEGAVFLCGYSFAGTVAFETACQLEKCGRRVAFLALIDTNCKADSTKLQPLTRRERQRNHRRIWRKLRPRDRFIYLSHYAQVRVSHIRNRFSQTLFSSSQECAKMAERAFHSKHELRAMNSASSSTYNVKPYVGRVTLFVAMLNYREDRKRDLGWGKFAAGGVQIVEVSGDHATMLLPPHSILLARRFQNILQQAQSEAQTQREAVDK